MYIHDLESRQQNCLEADCIKMQLHMKMHSESIPRCLQRGSERNQTMLFFLTFRDSLQLAAGNFNQTQKNFCVLFISSLLVLGLVSSACAERIFFAGYKGGFYIKSEEQGGMELRFGGAFQTDYRYYLEDERSDNRFDIRRARLRFRGQLTRYFRFGMEYEFEGNTTSNLIDAYGEGVYGPHALRAGQFKIPFSLEWQTRDKGLYFAERSIGYTIGPKYDIGLMLHGSFLNETLVYSGGLFNGDGDDGSSAGNEHDTPEIAGRIVVAPFKLSNTKLINSLQVGASATYGKIDTLNINLHAKSAGMIGTSRNIFVLTHNTKFGVIKDVSDRRRLNLEAAWAVSPFLFQGEYTELKYTGLEAAGSNPVDARFSSWYASATWYITGEMPVLSRGSVKPIYPNRFFNPEEGTWGAFCLSARVEHFTGDENWINPDSHNSVKKADAVSVAVNWILFPMVRIIADYTHTSLSDPIKVRELPDGTVNYIDKENVFTMRFSIDF